MMPRPGPGLPGSRCLPALLLLAAGLPAARRGAAMDLLPIIKSRGEVVIATDATYPPFEYKEQAALRGFDIELGTEIAREIGKQLGASVQARWLPMEWAGVLGSLETGKCDLVLSGVTITDERKRSNAFSRPYFLSGQTIARRKGDLRIRRLADLTQKTVSVQGGTTGQYALEKLGLPARRILKFDQLQDGLLDVRNGRSDAAVADEPALKTILRKGYPELELTGGVFVRENLGVVVRKDADDLLSAVNAALDVIMADGRYARIFLRWIEEPVTTTLIADLDHVMGSGTASREQVAAARTASASRGQAPSHPAATGSAFTLRWDLLRKALPLLLRQGATTTLALTLLTLLFGMPLGLLIALARISAPGPFRLSATFYVEVVRGTPLLMQIYVIYFVLPALHINLPGLLAATLALTVNAAAYIAEIFRAGIESIDVGQMEAARALGMDYPRAMRWVILPQALRRVLPPLTNEAVALLKDSSLVSVVALSELMRVGKEFATDAGSPTTIYLAVALLYLAMTLPLTYLVRRLETHWQPISRPRKQRSPMHTRPA